MNRETRIKSLQRTLNERILLLDGAMGTMIQAHRLTEDDFRGERFRDWERDLKGNNDLLSITRPQVIREIHRQFLEAGADVIETNTFNSNAPSMGDYGMESLVGELNQAAVRLARETADTFAARVGEPRYVAGVLGPEQSHCLDLTRCQRSGLSQYVLRATGSYLPGGRDGADRRRCRFPHG
jgi:5-methyltetrahydrofolate--homocysteine methyltransferase